MKIPKCWFVQKKISHILDKYTFSSFPHNKKFISSVDVLLSLELFIWSISNTRGTLPLSIFISSSKPSIHIQLCKLTFNPYRFLCKKKNVTLCEWRILRTEHARYMYVCTYVLTYMFYLLIPNFWEHTTIYGDIASRIRCKFVFNLGGTNVSWCGDGKDV